MLLLRQQPHECFLGSNSCPRPTLEHPPTHMCRGQHTHTVLFFSSPSSYEGKVSRRIERRHYFPPNPVKLNYHNRLFQRLISTAFPLSQGSSRVCVFVHVWVERQDVVGHCMLAQPALQTLWRLLEFWFHGCNVKELEYDLRIWTAFVFTQKKGYVPIHCDLISVF